MKTSAAVSGADFRRGSVSLSGFIFGAVFLAGGFRFGVSTCTAGFAISPEKSLFHSVIVTGIA
jgi:hypothetical protein